MSKKTELSTASDTVVGATYMATQGGFREMITAANAMVAKGYKLHSVVSMNGLIAATFVREKVLSTGAFFSETPDEDAEDW